PTSQPLPDTSARPFSARSSPANRHSCPSQRVVRYSGLDRIHSNPIDISGGGFLQVAVSEAPARDHAPATGCAAGAPDTALRLSGADPHIPIRIASGSRKEGGLELNRRICTDAVGRSNGRVSFSISEDETVVLDASAAAVAMQGLQFIFQRDREFSNSAPDFFGVYGGEP